MPTDKQDSEIKKGMMAVGYVEAGREFTILGESIKVNGVNWTPIVFDDEYDPTFLKNAAVSIIETLTSQQWYEKTYPNKELIILDPDGWDRSNYDYSWGEEKISFKEFQKRLMQSTVSQIRRPKKH